MMALLLIPWSMITVINAELWAYIYNGTYGVADYILNALGLGSPVILGTPTPAIIGLMIADIWKTTPFVAIIVLAGLVMLPSDVYEAAEMDGASGWYTFWHVTLPLLRPTIALAVMFRVLQAFGLFDLPYVMTGGGPGTATQSLAILAYNALFKNLVVRARRRRGDKHRAAGAARLPGHPPGVPCPGRTGRQLTCVTASAPAGTGTSTASPSPRWSPSLFILIPLYWLIATSFKDPNSIGNSPPSLCPTPLSGGNYSNAFVGYDFGIYFRNSLIVTIVATALVLILGTLAGYALGRLPMRGKFTTMVILLMISVFPAVAVLAPLYLLMRDLRLAEQLPGPHPAVHGLQPAVRHLDPAELLPRHPEGDGGDRPDRRRQPAAHASGRSSCRRRCRACSPRASSASPPAGPSS